MDSSIMINISQKIYFLKQCEAIKLFFELMYWIIANVYNNFQFNLKINNNYSVCKTR